MPSAPSSSTAVGTLTFPRLASSACIDEPKFHPCYISGNDLSGLSAESIQIVARLRADETHTGTLIVGLASEDEAAPEQLSNHGFNDVFKKPFDVALLGEKIKSIAEAKRED